MQLPVGVCMVTAIAANISYVVESGYRKKNSTGGHRIMADTALSTEILYEDKDIIVVNKPAGMASQPDRSLRPDMVNWLKNSFAGQNADIYVVHRLDLPVSGVMVYARNRKAAAALSAQVNDASGRRSMEKDYLAVLTGIPHVADEKMAKKNRLHMEAWLSKAKGKNLSVVTDQKVSAADWCALDYEILTVTEGSEPSLSLVRIHLLTGRRHQIRAMMAHAGAGVWGDKKYNPLFTSQRGPSALALQAQRLSFLHPASGKKMEFCLPPSEAILALMPDAGRFC